MRNWLWKSQWETAAASRYPGVGVSLPRSGFLAGQVNENCLRKQQPVHSRVRETSVCHAIAPVIYRAGVRAMSKFFCGVLVGF